MESVSDTACDIAKVYCYTGGHRKNADREKREKEKRVNKMDEMICFVDEDGKEVEMFVIEETRINNVNYILVTADDGEDEEAEAYILKDISDDEEEEAVYEIVDDASEIDYIGKIFAELLEDIDVTIED